jgi:hypothetical protein
VIYRSFFKAGLRFPLSRFLVEVLKIYQIFLHQITPEAIIRMEIFVWAVRSQGLEPSAKCFCSMHELVYETKVIGKEQYHNNFGSYGFIARPNASHPVPMLGEGEDATLRSSLRQSRCTNGGKTTGGVHPSSFTLQDEGLQRRRPVPRPHPT